MKLLLTTLCLFYFSTFVFSQSQDTIYWSASYKLKWEDFQGKADSSSQFGAISYPGIKYFLSANEDSFNVKVICFFIKSKSWVRVYSTIGLIHEQGHFDIAELFARKLRKSFAEYKFNYSTIGRDINQLFLTNKKERAKMDTLYDKETDFSRNRQKQQLGSKKIKEELDKLKKYSSS
ncbi:MAG TPA: hypothetical protein VL307_16930 [Chitinophagaceae bacterium]|jgi:hypothetical protein|nr:hypothetical protein [Chitinophagaceae bacterium]